MSRVLLLGASGTIGRATATALRDNGHNVTAFLRASSQFSMDDVTVMRGEVDALPSLRGYDAVVSCLASRSGAPKEAWAIDYEAHAKALRACQAAGVGQFVLLSALCVQKPRLAFQKAKLAFEQELTASGLAYSIVRPTAFFKSVTGQLDRVRAGKPYLMFGDGTRTACKPISDADLGAFLTRCLTDPALRNAVLPIGGPGPALTPRDIGEMLFRATGQAPRYRRVTPLLLQAIAVGLAAMGARTKAEFARTGHYYATESMLAWNGQRYSAEATPETGSDRLEHYIAARLRGQIADQRGAHAVF